MSMDAWQKYLNKLEPKKSRMVVGVLKEAMKYAPGSEAAMPYGVPGLKLGEKNLIAVAAHKEHLGIYPFSPKVVKAMVAKLPNISFAEGTMRFDFDKPPQSKVIKEIVMLRRKEIGI